MNLVFGSERAKVILEGQNVKPIRTLESGYKYVYFDLKSACKNCVAS
jgi:NAD dependent epimerase/dehydratase family enzyme